MILKRKRQKLELAMRCIQNVNETYSVITILSYNTSSLKKSNHWSFLTGSIHSLEI